MNFYRELVEIETKLVTMGFTVYIPVSAQTMKDKNDFDVSHFKGVFTPQEKAGFIRRNFEKIVESDAILVINNTKNGIDGYIGANVLMEISLAFFHKKKIYIWNPIGKDSSYKEELDAFGVEYIHKDLDKINFFNA